MADNDIQAWRDADALHARLIDLPREEQQRQLQAAQVSPTVRERVQTLLDQAGTVPPWLQRIERQGGLLALAGTAPGSNSATALIGRQVGRWQIVSELGRGGMAVVFRAQRIDGAAEQEAALKLLTIGSLGGSGADQFRRETDILARLQHPHIVGLLDAGITADGTPWLAMPLLQGQRIDHWCRERQVGTRELLRLFLQVCDAVAFAHRNLVIHRDLKPSNVLVDGDGQARLLDFGIARLADEPSATGTHWLALTPDFASPEQFRRAPPSTAMDIYGLGALLHCLLTGRAPRAGGSDTLTRPSLAVAAEPELAQRHQRALRGDLDRVVLKALAAEPERRYASVDELADDLRRWLDGRPVRATPPGRWYRLRKFVGRHRIGVAASLGAVLLLAAGIAATLWQAQQARQQAERAVAVRDLLVGVLQAADPTTQAGDDPPASELLRRGADKVRQTLANKPHLLAEMLQVIGQSQLNRAQLDDAARSLDDALALHDSGTVTDPSQHAEALHHRAKLSYEQGRTDTGIEQARTALALAARHGPEDLREQIQMRLADLLVHSRQLEEGSALAEDLIARIERRGEQPYPRRYISTLVILGRTAEYAGDLELAVAHVERAARLAHDLPGELRLQADADNSLGVLRMAQGRYAEARQALSSALAVQQRVFGPDHPDTLNTRSNLAGVLMMDGQPAEAATQFQHILRAHQAQAGGEPHPDVAILHAYVALARYLAGDTAGALADGEAAWAQMQALAGEDLGDLHFVPPMLGLLRLELGLPDPEDLLAEAAMTCTDISQVTRLVRSVCLARALQAADTGRCQVPHATEPRADPDGLDGIERRWWAVYWLLQATCPAPDPAGSRPSPATAFDPATLRLRMEALANGAEPGFPDWLLARIHSLPATATGAGTQPH